MKIHDDRLLEMEVELREAFKGYHFEISFFPAGGSICVEGCEQCGTEPGMHFGGWRTRAVNGPRTLSEAVAKLLKGMEPPAERTPND